MFMIITLDLSPFAVRVNGHMFVVSIIFFLHLAVKPRRHKICFDIDYKTVYNTLVFFVKIYINVNSIVPSQFVIFLRNFYGVMDINLL